MMYEYAYCGYLFNARQSLHYTLRNRFEVPYDTISHATFTWSMHRSRTSCQSGSGPLEAASSSSLTFRAPSFPANQLLSHDAIFGTGRGRNVHGTNRKCNKSPVSAKTVSGRRATRVYF